MTNLDTRNLGKLYESIGQESVLVPRRSKEERDRKYQITIQRQIADYIKNGSKGHLDFSGKPIISLPDNLKVVGGHLDLRNTPITSLPEGLSVDGSLDLRNTPITSLPEGLSVGWNLYLNLTKITSLPRGLKVGASLYLDYTKITSLPRDLKVGDTLSLKGTPIGEEYTKGNILYMCPYVNMVSL